MNRWQTKLAKFSMLLFLKEGGQVWWYLAALRRLVFFQRLSKSDIAWERVSIWLADERWVDSQDSASNEKLVRTHLLQNRATNARFISFTEEHFSKGLSAQHGALALQKNTLARVTLT
jgi:6-phosphogluconolactonase/glucosamine-6-phosphate isomerase/deaminase